MENSRIIKIFNVICLIMLLTLVVLALMQVTFRYVLEISVPWTEELARLFYSYLIFTGVVLVEGENQQMKTTFFLEILPQRLRFFIQVFINVVSMGFCGSLVYGASKMVASSWNFTLGSVPWLSTATVYIPIIACMPLVIYFLLKQLIFFKQYFLEHSNYSVEVDK